MRQVNVLGAALHQPETAADRLTTNLDNTLEVLDLAVEYDPDVVFFPEINLHHRYQSAGLDLKTVAQPVPGPATDVIGDRAASLDAYVLSPMLERDGDRIYNAAVLLGPDGAVQGTYRKIAPTINELQEGRRPGTALPTWDTEFGRISSLICWDSRFSELGIQLAQRNVDLLLFPTHDSGGSRDEFQVWSKRYGMHIAAASTERAQVFTPTGILGEVSSVPGNPVTELSNGGRVRFSFARLNTDFGIYGRYQTREVIDDIQSTYRGRIAFHELDHAGVIMIESLAESPTIEDLEAEYPLRSAYDPGELDTMFAYEDRTRAHVRKTVNESPLLEALEPAKPTPDEMISQTE